LGFVSQPNLRDRRSHFDTSSSVSGTDFKTSIWQSRIPEQNTVHLENTHHFSANHISFNQISPTQLYTSQIRMPQTSLNQISTSQISSSQTRSSETGVPKIGIHQIGSNQIGIGQVSSYQARIAQINSRQKASSEIGTHQIDASKVSSFERHITTNDINSNKTSFSSGIEFKQFFPSNFSSKTKSVHNSTPEIINELNNSATDIDSFDEQNIEPEAIYQIKSTNIPLTNIPDSLWVSPLNPTYAIGDRTIQMKHGKLQ
jgi:hypothetical protein